jgi:hypothetical protein
MFAKTRSSRVEGHLSGEQTTGGGRGDPRVRVGAPDRSLTGVSGMVAITELCEQLEWLGRWMARWVRSSNGFAGTRREGCWSGWPQRSWWGSTIWWGWTATVRMWLVRR